MAWHGRSFLFLSVLVVAVRVMSFVIRRYFPVPTMPLANEANKPCAQNALDPQLLQVLQAAIDAYRRRQP